MDTNDYIRALNQITEPHFTPGGSHLSSGNRALDCYVLAAWYTRTALDEHEPTDKRVCALLRAYEESAIAGVLDPYLNDAIPNRETVLNAIAWATSLVCDRIRALDAGK